MTVTQADMLPEGWKLWLRWLEILKAAGYPERRGDEVEMVRLDAGRMLGFSRVVATNTRHVESAG